MCHHLQWAHRRPYEVRDVPIRRLNSLNRSVELWSLTARRCRGHTSEWLNVVWQDGDEVSCPDFGNRSLAIFSARVYLTVFEVISHERPVKLESLPMRYQQGTPGDGERESCMIFERLCSLLASPAACGRLASRLRRLLALRAAANRAPHAHAGPSPAILIAHDFQ